MEQEGVKILQFSPTYIKLHGLYLINMWKMGASHSPHVGAVQFVLAGELCLQDTEYFRK